MSTPASLPVEPFTIEQFYKFLQDGKLMAGICQKCKKVHLPPRPYCDKCGSQQFSWLNISGKAKLVTYTIINVAPQQFQSMTPYAVGIVQLSGGMRIPGMIQGVPHDQLKIGMNLLVDFGTCNQPQQWPAWF
ncbi:MAG TPA: Zn-ribbon domain-containing OB-fold protein, partial [Candidatus Acidoferrales bacterium]|nr:Zn-ribbon domain-containing OB-fold protein [Candidatus Acidoferrales bacterium]